MKSLDLRHRTSACEAMLVAAACLAIGAVTPQAHAAVVPFAAHQAVYDLTLAKSKKLSLQSIRGRIVYKFTGSACAGYTTQVRQVTEMDNGEGTSNLNDLRSKTWEDDKGKVFRFHSTNYVDEQKVTTVDGQAKRDAMGIQVVLKQPKAKTFRLSKDTVFPTEQLRRVIAAARAGQNVIAMPVYDGSENGEKVYYTLAVIGKMVPPSTKADDASADQPALANVARWPVRVSYFNLHFAGEQTPDYSIAFELYENGISRGLTLDYNDFVIGGHMSKLEFMEPQACK